eukprot:scaffold142346_cov154-Phaeocystis_antarctica.AAC.1
MGMRSEARVHLAAWGGRDPHFDWPDLSCEPCRLWPDEPCDDSDGKGCWRAVVTARSRAGLQRERARRLRGVRYFTLQLPYCECGVKRRENI